jgi:hypothetical protein
VFVDSSEDFEHVESPRETVAQATPTQATSEGTTNLDWGGSEGSDELPLPPGWEERQTANGGRIYVNHLTREVCRYRPGSVAPFTITSATLTTTPAATPTATPTSQPPLRRAFMERHTSIEVCTQYSMADCIPSLLPLPFSLPSCLGDRKHG